MKNIRSSFFKREARFGLYIFGAAVILAGRVGVLNRPTEAVLVLVTLAALYGRGVARQKKGDRNGGNSDITAARGLKAGIAEEMNRYGVRLN